MDERFYDKVMEIIKQYDSNYDKSLEQYLSSLLRIARNHTNTECCQALIEQIIEKSFLEEPIEFDSKWLEYNSPPDDKEFTDSFECFVRTVLFQISDLHKMKINGTLDNEMRYLGTTSSTNNSWYNFDPFTYLECGAEGIVGGFDCGRLDKNDIGWHTFTEFIELGRLYE